MGYGKLFSTLENTGPGFLEGSPAGRELRAVTACWRQEAGITAGEIGQRVIESESNEKESAMKGIVSLHANTRMGTVLLPN